MRVAHVQTKSISVSIYGTTDKSHNIISYHIPHSYWFVHYRPIVWRSVVCYWQHHEIKCSEYAAQTQLFLPLLVLRRSWLANVVYCLSPISQHNACSRYVTVVSVFRVCLMDQSLPLSCRKETIQFSLVKRLNTVQKSHSCYWGLLHCRRLESNQCRRCGFRGD
jgi:hypothetical protein